MKTRAIRIEAQGPPSVMQMVEVELPDPGPDEARVRHTAIGLNYMDVYQRGGQYQVTLPMGLGLEAAGRRGNLEIPGVFREDVITRYKAGIRLRVSENSIGRRVEYSITAGRYERNSSDDRLDRNRGTFGINVIVGY